MRAPLAAKGLLIAEIFGAIAGFSGGEPLLLHDPSRRLLRLPSDLLKGLPITNYFPAGLWLFFVYGAGLSLEIYGLWRQKRWAWPLGILLGVIWRCWLSFEFYLSGLQPFIAIGWFNPSPHSSYYYTLTAKPIFTIRPQMVVWRPSYRSLYQTSWQDT